MEIIDDDEKKLEAKKRLTNRKKINEDNKRKAVDKFHLGTILIMISLAVLITYAGFKYAMSDNDEPVENVYDIEIMRKYALVMNINKSICPDLEIKFNNRTLPIENVKEFNISFVDLGYHSEVETFTLEYINTDSCINITTIDATLMPFNAFTEILIDAGVPLIKK